MTGKRRDGHFAFAIGALAQRGLELACCQYLSDDPHRLTAVLAQSMRSGEAVFSFGGIGATPDDHTRQCAADAAGVTLEPHPEAVTIIKERFGADATPQRIKMAHLPKGCELIPNPVNRIAGFSVGDLHFVPGFPQMGQPMLEWVLDERYHHLHRSDPPIEALITMPGISEGQLMPFMHEIVARFSSVQLSCLPHMDGEYRETEIGLRGQPEDVEPARVWLCTTLDENGINWRGDARGKP